MNFGIEEMQLSALVAGISGAASVQAAVSGFHHPQFVRQILQHGFNPIELSGDLALFFPHAFNGQAVEGLAALKQEEGARYTVHLPLWSSELSTPLEPVRSGSIAATVETIRQTLPLNPEMYVLHATGALASEFFRMRLPEQARQLIVRQFQANALRSLESILKETSLPSRKLAIETIEFPFAMTLEMAQALDLSICLDVGHILSGFSGDVQLFDVLEHVLPRLGEIHLHDSPYQAQDAIRYGMDHHPLGTGDLDTQRLLTRLSEAGYNGPIVFELEIAAALQSLQVIHDFAA